MRSRFSRSARETAWSTALTRLGSFGMRILNGFSDEIARFLILEARCPRVNHLRVSLCPEVPRSVESVVWKQGYITWCICGCKSFLRLLTMKVDWSSRAPCMCSDNLYCGSWVTHTRADRVVGMAVQ